MVRTDIEQTVEAWLRCRQICRTGLMIGVSGGADSVALLRAIGSCRRSLSLDVCVAHLDHGLRAESAADAEWVRGFAKELGLPAVVERTDVSRDAAETGRGIEETARAARDEFFRRAAIDQRCAHVAVAHTADDQAETILHHLLRGTGLAGLRGMPETRPLTPGVTLIRPLLGLCRADVLEYLAGLGQEFRIDATNDDERFTRNRLRHTLLPLLEEQFNPQVSGALTRLGRQVADTQQLVEKLAHQLLEAAVIERTSNRVVLDFAHLREADRHLLRESLRILWTQQEWPRRRMSYDHWDRLAVFAQSEESSKSLTLPHAITAMRIGSTIELSQAEPGSGTI